MSTEYWIIYDVATGAELMRGHGPNGSSAIQVLEEGWGLMPVSRAAAASLPLDLELVRADLRAKVDVEAEATRQLFVTPGSGQAMEYAEVRAELARYDAVVEAGVAPDPNDYPFVQEESATRGVSLTAIFDEVRTALIGWTVVGKRIRAARMGAKAVIGAADNLTTLAAAAAVDWQAVLAQPEN